MVPDIFLLWTGEYPTGLQADLLQVPAVDLWQQAPAGTPTAGLALQINGCFGKMDDHPVHTTPSHHPPKMDVPPKIFLQSSLSQNSSCANQVRPQTSYDDLFLPFCLILTVFYCLAQEAPMQGHRLILVRY